MTISGSSAFRFDIYNQNELPYFYLLNPDETPIYNLGSIYNRKFELRYNTLSTFSFTAPSVVNGEAQDYYNYLQYRRLINVENIGNFMITEVKISNDGINEIKEVTCKSLENIFAYKKLSLFNGTFTFNNVISGSGTTSTQNLMTTILSYVPGWTLGYIDPLLTNITLNFDITDKTLYDFMISDVAQSYQCIFVFDSLEKTVSAYSVTNATVPTDIFISFENLMKSFTISESTDEMVTALNVLGGDGISINYVNPLGTNTIYDFDYYKTIQWMSQDLIDALDVWEVKVASYQPTYANFLTSLRIENADLIVLESELVDLETELAVLNNIKEVRNQQNLDTTEVSGSIANTSGSIIVKEAEIVSEQAVISGINAQLTAINQEVSFSCTEISPSSGSPNFTLAQFSSLNNFIIGNTYTNTNFIETSLMSEVDVQNVSQRLYDQAVIVLDKVSEPRYNFEISAANFLFIKDFQPFISQIALGCTMTIELNSGSSITAALLGIDFNYDDPADFNMILSNRLRLDDEQFQYSDLMDSTVDAGVTANFNSQKWNNFSNSYASVVSGANIVASITPSIANNIALFSDATGTRIKDSQALYLEPTAFTPSLISTDATFTYNYCTGYYAVVGRVLSFEASISVSGIAGTTTNQVYIAMPMLHKNITNLMASFRITCGGITFGAGYTAICGILANNSSSMGLYKEGTGAALTALLASELGATTTIIHVTGSYLIN